MKLIDTIEINSGTDIRRLELLVGDLTEIPDEHRIDVLIVSAFPHDYVPTSSSLIGALDAKGLSVATLARRPEADLRSNFSCWISREIKPAIHGLSFRRLLCFEPAVRARPPELVGDIFRALAPFVYAEPAIRSMAMPVVAAGDQGYSISTMLPPLLDAAKHWLAIGFPMHTIKLVVRSESALAEALPIFRKYGRARTSAKNRPRKPARRSGAKAPIEHSARYDVFVSYSHQDGDAARHLAANLQRFGLRVFIDRSEIDVGASWQQKIFDALESCSATATLYSPSYLQSKVCQEEFNISRLRHRESDQGVIFPVLLEDTELPAYMRVLNYVDCRINDMAKIASAADNLAS
jgi:TIR domain